MKDKKLAKKIAGGILNYLSKIKSEHILPLVITYLSKNIENKVAEITVPRKLSSSETEKIESMLINFIGYKPEKTIFLIDDSIIDGIKISYEDQYWDFSTAGQIESITKQI